MLDNATSTNGFRLDGHSPVYIQLRDHLRKVIHNLDAGARLPPERVLARELNVDRATLRRALLNLSDEGYVVRQQGRGTFVGDPQLLPVENEEAVSARATHEFKSDSPSRPDENEVSDLVSVIIPDLEIPSHVRLLKGVLAKLKERGAKAWVQSSMVDMDYERELLVKLMEEKVDGVITVPLFGNSLDQNYAKILNDLCSSGKRVVTMEQYIASPLVRSVMVDRVKSSYSVTEHLIMSGHRRIAAFTGKGHSYSGSAYFRGYKQALADYDCEFDATLTVDFDVKESASPAYDRAMELLTASSLQFTAIVAAPFSIAYGVYRAIKELGLVDEIELVGEDLHFNPELSRFTHTRQPFYEIGQQAVDLLFSESGGDSPYKRHIQIEPEVFFRKAESTA